MVVGFLERISDKTILLPEPRVAPLGVFQAETPDK